ncbi:MAG: adenosylmethionine decarboxylase [Candidatus Verstraetearchaeota archaeon]|jgi:S-adenosylmethionine decarboxylase|nr:adenosylmethionine decarboxylase [Candidatus Verstraetearchaeota archaeon]
MREIGRHLIIELFGCDAKALNDIKTIEENFKRSLEEAGAKIIGEVFHKFNPQGVTGVIIIAESHFSIHTWPEIGYAAIDLFTCGTKVDPTKVLNKLTEIFKPTTMNVMELKRGILVRDRI